MVLRRVSVIDSHTEGNPTRVVVSGVDEPSGTTILERVASLRSQDDALRGFLNFEPRGNPMMCSVILLPPQHPDADLAAVIIEQDEYVPMCGHCIIGAATTAVYTGLVAPTGDSTVVRFETVAGIVACAVDTRDGSPGAVTLQNVDSFLLHKDHPVTLANRGEVAVDIAFGGDFYAIVSADALGLDLVPSAESRLAQAAHEIIDAVNDQVEVRHPERADITRCYEVMFTTQQVPPGRFRHAVISPPGVLDRSPCGTGTSARLAALDARGLVRPGSPYRFEGILGTAFTGSADSSEWRSGMRYTKVRITGRAYVTAVSTLLLDPDDPFPAGYRVGHPIAAPAGPAPSTP